MIRNLRDLEYLIAVAELRSFRRAAEHCHVSQPALSNQIRKLEETLGVQLFERSNKRVITTEVGMRLVEAARRVSREVRSLDEIAASARDPLSGRFRLGAFPTLSPYLFPTLVPRLMEVLPQLKPVLVEEKTRALIERLHAGTLDAAFVALPIHDERLASAALFEDEFWLAVPASHPFAKRKQIDQAALASEALLLLDEGHCLRDQALEFCRQNTIDESREFRATSLETLIQMVATDMGVTLVPEMATRDPPRHLRFIPFRPPKPHRTIGLVWRRNASQQPFFEQLGELMRNPDIAAYSAASPLAHAPAPGEAASAVARDATESIARP